jgi:hypothetical protein
MGLGYGRGLRRLQVTFSSARHGGPYAEADARHSSTTTPASYLVRRFLPTKRMFASPRATPSAQVSDLTGPDSSSSDMSQVVPGSKTRTARWRS